MWQPIETLPTDGRRVLLWYEQFQLQLPGDAGDFDKFMGERPTHWMDVLAMWQPIETHPADTPILLWDQGDGIEKCVVAKWDSELEYWALGYGAEYQPYGPTHWMPLPDRP